jgi:hypothetical protein
MIQFIKKIIEKIKERRRLKKLEKLYKGRLKELKKRDPFIYKH